jgi:hypothetical protein
MQLTDFISKVILHIHRALNNVEKKERKNAINRFHIQLRKSFLRQDFRQIVVISHLSEKR